MRHGSQKFLHRLSVGTLGMAVATVSFFGTLQFSAVPQTRTSDNTVIDRTFKGDRLLTIPGVGAGPAAPTADPALPKGCVARADGTRTIFATEVPGRCLAAAPDRIGVG
jgi:hypothetical protein